MKITINEIARLITEAISEGENTNGVLDKTFITYGLGNEFLPDKFNEVNFDERRTKSLNKPIGGLWASPIDSEFGWKEWCNSEQFYTNGGLETSFCFKLKPNARIYVIDNMQDLKQVSTAYDHFGRKCIDFKALRNNGFDGILVTSKAAMDFHNYSGMEDVSDLNVWDCESICIFNKNAIIPINNK